MKRDLIVTALCAGLMLFSGPQNANGQQEARPDDVATVDGIIRAYYEVVSGPAGGIPDRERDRTLHHPEAWMSIAGLSEDGRPIVEVMTLDEYHDRTGGPRTEPFWEWETSRVTNRHGNMVHVWSHYASALSPDGEPFSTGVNSITLFNDGERWWIMSWMFDGSPN